MKFKFLFTLLLGSTLAASAQQGYKDGVEYFRADQPEEAAIILNRTFNDPSTDKATALFFLGQIALHDGNVAEAKSFFDKGIAADPANGYNYVGLGALALKNGDKAAAENYFKQGKDHAKKDAVLLIDIARAYFNTDPVAYAKEIQKALNDAKKADKQAPVIYIFEGDMAAGENVGTAAGFYEMAQTFDKNMSHPEAYVKYARVYFPVNHKFAIDKLKELLEKQPNSALAQRELAEKYFENDQLTMAAEQYGKYIQNPNHFDKDKQRYVGLLFFGKKYQESFDLAKTLLAKDPSNIYMQRMLFFNQAAMKHWNEADKYAKEFFAHPSQDFVSSDYAKYGEVLQELGQDSLAVPQFEQAVNLNPEKLELLKDLSSAYSSAKMYLEAAETYEKYINTVESPLTNDIFTLARRYQNAASVVTDSVARLAVLDKALNYVNMAQEKAPENALVANTKARILLVKNNGVADQDVVDAFVAAVALMDTDPENVVKRKNDYIVAYQTLANYYLANKDVDNAKLYLNKFLEVDPENEPLRTYIESLK